MLFSLSGNMHTKTFWLLNDILRLLLYISKICNIINAAMVFTTSHNLDLRL